MSKRKRPSDGISASQQQQQQVATSYGVLLYRKVNCSQGHDDGDDDDKNRNNNANNDNNNEEKTNKKKKIQFLLGMIPQRNWWTVFKGLPDNNDEKEEEETPYETALREFEEETGTKGLLSKIEPEHTLTGSVNKYKKLEIYLQDGSNFDESKFDLSKVVKIDSGYMKGQPEIIKIQWLTLDEALITGMDGGAKIYKSQQHILKQAHDFLSTQIDDNDNNDE